MFQCQLCCLKCEGRFAFAAFIFKPGCGSGSLFGLVWSVFFLIKNLKL